MKYLTLVIFFFILTQFTQAVETSSTKAGIDYPSENNLQKILSNFSFGYSMIYLGPSLSSDHQTGATFNRFQTGQDYKGDENDYIGSYQIYHAAKLSYQIAKNYTLSYNYTFQNDLHDVNYHARNFDGSTTTYKRDASVTYNDEQVSLWMANLAETDLLYFNMGLVYQIPTTEGSKANEMNYALGIQPSVNIKTSLPGIYTGLNSSILRGYYKREEYTDDCGGTPCKYPTKFQTLAVSISPYLNYSLTDKILLKSSLSFDWDQDGKEVYTRNFNNNMMDVGNAGVDYFITKQLKVGTNLQFALVEASAKKTALSFTFNLTL